LDDKLQVDKKEFSDEVVQRNGLREYNSLYENDDFFQIWCKEANLDALRVSVSHDFDYKHNWAKFELDNYQEQGSLNPNTPRDEDMWGKFKNIDVTETLI